MTGLLLINLGTPDSPSTADVRRYLRQFLSDPRVIDIHPAARWLLLNLVILPTRPAKSAEAYQKIWTERGSPLLFHSQDLADAVQAALGQDWKVVLAMRYGQPDIRSGMRAMLDAGVDRVVVLPLYPQYASASTATAWDAMVDAGRTLPAMPSVHAIADFYDEPGFIQASADVARPTLDGLFGGAPGEGDHVLLSFHGLPERQVKASDLTGHHCLAGASCCDAMVPANRYCYRAQSYATARALAAALDLPDGRWSVSFQSRLGRTPWIQPYTDVVVEDLAKAGVKRLAVLCPSFTADCLETLEEIGIRLREQWAEAGGTELALAPCVNSDPRWVEAVVAMARRAAGA